MALAPAVGLALGAAAAVVLYVFQRYWHAGPLLGSALAIITLAVLTRGLHLTAWPTTADGLGSRRPAAGALEIMRRSDIGPFGVAVLVLTLLLQVTALTQADALGRGVTSVAAAALCGRLAMAWACGRGIPPARPDGLGALVAGSLHRRCRPYCRPWAWPGSSAYGLIFPVRCRRAGPRGCCCAGWRCAGWAGSPGTCSARSAR
jgi:adenosylcobinamide-GDP ribazoletransferase